MAERVDVLVIAASTRQGREGEKVARAVLGLAQKRPDLRAELVDLREWPLPFFDEPKPPSLNQFQSELARRWNEKIGSADAFVLVTPEYNHGYPAVLKNALDYAYVGWNRKPVGFVSYSSGSVAGTRAVEQLRQVVVELQMASIREQLAIPQVDQAFETDGTPKAPAALERRAARFFDQLVWWARALRAARTAEAAP